MPQLSANSPFNSLKGRIRLATGALAFFICIFGLVSYLVVSFISADLFYALFAPFIVLAVTVVVFGWWLSNEIVRPVEKVSLLAKSLERGTLTSLPRTSGADETDELMHSLHRSSQQIQTLVSLMERVANGELNAALAPAQAGDRLSLSFQKLLGKVSESIYAQQNLDRLKQSLGQLAREVAPVAGGAYGIEIKSETSETRDVAAAFKLLLQDYNELLRQIRTETGKASRAAAETQKAVRQIIEVKSGEMAELDQAGIVLGKLPGGVQKISEELSQSAESAGQTIDKTRRGIETAQANLTAVGDLRKQLQEAVKRVNRLNERSRGIDKISKEIEDLAHRTNLIAINASIHTAADDAAERGFTVIVEEIDRLAMRAAETNRQVSALNQTISAEVVQIERLLEETIGEIAVLSRFAIETGGTLSEVEWFAGKLLNLQNRLQSFSSEQFAGSEKAFQTFINSIAEKKKTMEILKETDGNLSQILIAAENLKSFAPDRGQTAVGEQAAPAPKDEPWNDPAAGEYQPRIAHAEITVG